MVGPISREQENFQALGSESNKTSKAPQTLFEEFTNVLKEVAGKVAKFNSKNGQVQQAILDIKTTETQSQKARSTEKAKAESDNKIAPLSIKKADTSSTEKAEVAVPQPKNEHVVDENSENATKAESDTSTQDTQSDSNDEESTKKEGEASERSLDLAASIAGQQQAQNKLEQSTVQTEEAAQSPEGLVNNTTETIIESTPRIASSVEKAVNTSPEVAKVAPKLKEVPSTTSSAPTAAAQVINPEVPVQNLQSSAAATNANSETQVTEAIIEKSTVPQELQKIIEQAALTRVSAQQLTDTNTIALERDSLVSSLLVKSLLDSASMKVSELKGAQGISAVGGASSIAQGNSTIAPQGFGQSRSGEVAKPDNTPRAPKPTKILGEQQLEKVEAAIKESAKAKDGSTISLRLDPPSLGSVNVDVTLKDGTLHARIVPENPQVGQFLREKAQELLANLRKLGLDVQTISVSVTADNSHGEYFAHDAKQDARQQTKEQGSQLWGDNSNAILGSGGSLESSSMVKYDHWVA